MRSHFFLITYLLILISTLGCKKYMDIPPPANKIAGEGAYSTDRSSAATLSNVLGIISTNQTFAGSSNASIGYGAGLYTDELQNLNSINPNNVAFYRDQVVESITGLNWTYWYSCLYNINLTIEGVGASATLNHKDQWLGEAHFLRALLHFYLVNLYGDVPISKTSDFSINRSLARSSITEVYKHIIADLVLAQAELGNEYRDAAANKTSSRGRPNKYAATALLAKAYLYAGDYTNAEAEATKVITGLIGAEPAASLLPSANIDQVFLANSTETIFALDPGVKLADFEAYTMLMPDVIPAGVSWSAYGIAAALSPTLVSAFEVNPSTMSDDRRKTYWTRSTTRLASATIREQTMYFPYKYKSSVAGTENIVLLRLAEQYLIRAEARARLNNTDGAKADINVIRARAGLLNTTAVNATELVTAILHEKRVELFTEQANRFFDLRRSGTLDAVMSVIAPSKGIGATWNPFKQYYPIPAYDISVNPKLVQTPGY